MEITRVVFAYGHSVPLANIEHITRLPCRDAMSFPLNSVLWWFVAGAVLIFFVSRVTQ
jgi:hypothetical protein